VDESKRRAWEALALGPLWRLRDPPSAPPTADDVARAEREGHAGQAVARRHAERAEPRAVAPRRVLGATHRDDDGSAPDEDASRRDDAAGPPHAAQRAAAGPEDGPEVGPEDGAGARSADVAIAQRRPGAPATAPEGREQVIARMPWPVVAEAVSGCVACPLSRSRRNTVFGVGPQPAEWLLVGEAPGEQEDARGEPFVGPAGLLLDRMLASIGVDRARDAFIANVLKCRPPRNRDPQPAEVAACEPYLLRQIELLEPRIIVVLGRFAAQSLLRTDATIASLRGRPHAYRVGDREIPMVVTYHPAYLLRNLPDKARAWADLRLARRSFDAAGR
jgi:uracil-DNA glycosylase family 4